MRGAQVPVLRPAPRSGGPGRGRRACDALWLVVLLAGSLLGGWHAMLEPFVAHEESLPHLSTGHSDSQSRPHLDGVEPWRDHHCAACRSTVQRPSLPLGGRLVLSTPPARSLAADRSLQPPQPDARFVEARGPPSLLA